MTPVFEDPALGQQLLQHRRSISRNAGGQHQMLVAFDRGDGIELHGLEPANLLTHLLRRGRAPRTVVVVGEEILGLEQEAADCPA